MYTSKAGQTPQLGTGYHCSSTTSYLPCHVMYSSCACSKFQGGEGGKEGTQQQSGITKPSPPPSIPRSSTWLNLKKVGESKPRLEQLVLSSAYTPLGPVQPSESCVRVSLVGVLSQEGHQVKASSIKFLHSACETLPHPGEWEAGVRSFGVVPGLGPVACHVAM